MLGRTGRWTSPGLRRAVVGFLAVGVTFGTRPPPARAQSVQDLVRDEAAYAALARAVFPSLRVEVRDQAWIPYTHCFMECTRA